MVVGMSFFVVSDVYAQISEQNDILASISYDAGVISGSNIGRGGGVNPEYSGFKVQMPHNGYICGFKGLVFDSGDPSGFLKLRLYSGVGNGGVLIAESANGYADDDIAEAGYTPVDFYFTNNVCYFREGGDIVTFVLYKTGNSDTSNYFHVAINTGVGRVNDFYPSASISYDLWTDFSGLDTSKEAYNSSVYGIDDFSVTIWTPSGTASRSGASLSGAKAFCDSVLPTGGFIDFGNNLCFIGLYLFLPSSDVLSEFRSMDLDSKFPFNWVLGFYNSYNEFAVSSSLSSQFSRYASLSFNNLDFDTTSSHTVSFNLFNTASASSYISQGAIDTIRSFLASILWITFGIYVYKLIINVI